MVEISDFSLATARLNEVKAATSAKMLKETATATPASPPSSSGAAGDVVDVSTTTRLKWCAPPKDMEHFDAAVHERKNAAGQHPPDPENLKESVLTTAAEQHRTTSYTATATHTKHAKAGSKKEKGKGTGKETHPKKTTPNGQNLKLKATKKQFDKKAQRANDNDSTNTQEKFDGTIRQNEKPMRSLSLDHIVSSLNQGKPKENLFVKKENEKNEKDGEKLSRHVADKVKNGAIVVKKAAAAAYRIEVFDKKSKTVPGCKNVHDISGVKQTHEQWLEGIPTAATAAKTLDGKAKKKKDGIHGTALPPRKGGLGIVGKGAHHELTPAHRASAGAQSRLEWRRKNDPDEEVSHEKDADKSAEKTPDDKQYKQTERTTTVYPTYGNPGGNALVKIGPRGGARTPAGNRPQHLRTPRARSPVVRTLGTTLRAANHPPRFGPPMGNRQRDRYDERFSRFGRADKARACTPVFKGKRDETAIKNDEGDTSERDDRNSTAESYAYRPRRFGDFDAAASLARRRLNQRGYGRNWEGQSLLNRRPKDGKVKWFNPQRGFGYIVVDQPPEEVYVHAVDVEKTPQMLEENERVRFFVVDDEGPSRKAVNVRPLYDPRSTRPLYTLGSFGALGFGVPALPPLHFPPPSHLARAGYPPAAYDYAAHAAHAAQAVAAYELELAAARTRMGSASNLYPVPHAAGYTPRPAPQLPTDQPPQDPQGDSNKSSSRALKIIDPKTRKPVTLMTQEEQIKEIQHQIRDHLERASRQKQTTEDEKAKTEMIESVAEKVHEDWLAELTSKLAHDNNTTSSLPTEVDKDKRETAKRVIHNDVAKESHDEIPVGRVTKDGSCPCDRQDDDYLLETKQEIDKMRGKASKHWDQLKAALKSYEKVHSVHKATHDGNISEDVHVLANKVVNDVATEKESVENEVAKVEADKVLHAVRTRSDDMSPKQTKWEALHSVKRDKDDEKTPEHVEHEESGLNAPVEDRTTDEEINAKTEDTRNVKVTEGEESQQHDLKPVVTKRYSIGDLVELSGCANTDKLPEKNCLFSDSPHRDKIEELLFSVKQKARARGYTTPRCDEQEGYDRRGNYGAGFQESYREGARDGPMSRFGGRSPRVSAWRRRQRADQAAWYDRQRAAADPYLAGMAAPGAAAAAAAAVAAAWTRMPASTGAGVVPAGYPPQTRSVLPPPGLAAKYNPYATTANSVNPYTEGTGAQANPYAPASNAAAPLGQPTQAWAGTPPPGLGSRPCFYSEHVANFPSGTQSTTAMPTTGATQSKEFEPYHARSDEAFEKEREYEKSVKDGDKCADAMKSENEGEKGGNDMYAWQTVRGKKAGAKAVSYASAAAKGDKTSAK